jgi:hypothetical protein
VADHGAEEAERALDIDAVVVERALSGFADGLFTQLVSTSCDSVNNSLEIKRTFSAAKWMTLSISG